MGVRSLVAAAATALLLAGCSGDAVPVGTAAPPASTSTAPTDTVDPDDVPPCPRWDADPSYPAGAMPAGATSIRVCPGEETVQAPRFTAAIAAPRDALTSGVDDLVTLLNDLPDWEGLPENTYCSSEGRPRIHYVLGYPDGSTRSVTYGYGGCHLLELEAPAPFPTAGTVAKQDAAPFMEAVADGLLAQRSGGQQPHGGPAAPRCVPNTRDVTTVPTADLELATAALCVLDGERWRRAVVPPDLVARLSDEYAVTSTDAAGCTVPFAGKVVGRSTWGDPVELQLGAECTMAGSPRSPEPVSWTLSSDLADDLSSLPLGPPVEQR
ncbi:hypothetical protein [Nocardioides terrigena]|uniref:hypothetical protein n=1 Tax=Nocardioides terrigena TaxID=424797 RepID=UPI00131F3D37|nr:hypothetical protein [Nocardioides terrigena]